MVKSVADAVCSEKTVPHHSSAIDWSRLMEQNVDEQKCCLVSELKT